jgi:transcriptional regulator with XRE-family HTH domain
MTPGELRHIRKEHDLTQRQMGELLGYTANYISRLERGEVPITQRLEKLLRNVIFQRRAKKVSRMD